MNTTADIEMPLILNGEGYGLEISQSYEELKAELLKDAARIIAITDAAADSAADIQLKKLAAMRIEVEKSRVKVKEPALQFGKMVDAKAKEFVADITTEENRLKAERGTYAQAVLAERNRIIKEQEEKRMAEEKARREEEAKEAARIEAARIEAERKEAEAAEAARRKAEEDAFNATTPEEEAAAEKAAAEAKRKADEAARLEAERKEAARLEAEKKAAEVSVPTFIPEAPKGVKMVADYEITDIDALYRHNAGLVTLTERRKEILDAIARGMIGNEPPQIPGLRTFMRPQVR